MARILLADDHDVVCAGLKCLIEAACPRWHVIGAAIDGPQAVKMALVERPDLVILTHLLPQLSGVDVTKSIKATHPRMPVMFYCRCAHESLVREAIAAGACSYVLKSNPGRMVVEAVGEVLAGKPYFCPGVIEAAMLSGRRGDSVLTPRQRSIMRLISDGQSNKQVARSLSISIKTVESHRAQLMRRLDLTSIAGLVRYAVRNGISEL